MARFCTTCGRQLREGDSFCLGCGAPIAKGGSPAGRSAGAPTSVLNTPPTTLANADFQQTIGVDSESDMAATEVWQVPVEKTPNHADPFVVEVPKDELRISAGRAPAPFEPAADAPDSDLPFDSVFGGVGEAGSFDSPGSSPSILESLMPIVGDAEGDEYDESPTIVASPLVSDDDDEEDSPTIVVARERYVLVRDEDGQRTELSLPCILGRGKAADKRVKGNLAISRKHAKLFQEDGLVMIEDLKSTNGTFVDGAQLEEGRCAPVADGAAVRLGTEDFTFHVESI